MEMQIIPWMNRKTNEPVLQERDENCKLLREIRRRESRFVFKASYEERLT